MNTYWHLFSTFSILSLCSVGGINTSLPEMQYQAVVVHQWLSTPEFLALFSLAQAAPGPNILIASLIGQHIAGFGGAIIATLGACLPTCLLSYQVGKLWHRLRDTTLRQTLQLGLAPISVGLLFATAYTLASHAPTNPASYWLITLATVITVKTRLNPLWLIAAGALYGLFWL